MFRQSRTELTVATRGRGFHEVTADITRLVHASGVTTGLRTRHLRPTSASLLVQENADPDRRVDLENLFAPLVPDGDPHFIHMAEDDDDMSAHIRTALTTVNLSIPVARGVPVLGTWQGIYVWEHRARPHRRQLVVHMLGE